MNKQTFTSMVTKTIDQEDIKLYHLPNLYEIIDFFFAEWENGAEFVDMMANMAGTKRTEDTQEQLDRCIKLTVETIRGEYIKMCMRNISKEDADTLVKIMSRNRFEVTLSRTITLSCSSFEYAWNQAHITDEEEK